MAENSPPAETNLIERFSLFFLCAIGSMHKQISQSPNAQTHFAILELGYSKKKQRRPRK
jgi:hypothetical protein